MFKIMVSEEVKGTNHDESSDDDTPVVTSNLDRVLTLGVGDSGATDHLWDNTHKDLLYDTQPSSKSYMPPLGPMSLATTRSLRA